MLAALSLLLFAAPPPAAADQPRPRVFFAELSAGAGASVAEAHLITEAMIVEARQHADRFDVIGTADLTSVLDIEASRQAMGCAGDSISCASEIADALNAPFIVQGTLGRVGETWVLTLSRLERATLQNVARTQVQAPGEHADVLLPKLKTAVREVLGVPASADAADGGVSPLVIAGAGVMGAGALVGVGAGAAYLFARSEYDAGLAETDVDKRRAHKSLGEPVYYASIIGAITAGALLAGGAGVLVLGVLLPADTE